MDDKLTDLQAKAWDVIKLSRLGNEITGKEIANSIGLKPRSSGKSGADMRQVINALRCKGYPICANGGGYYAATTFSQIKEYCESFQARINDQRKALDGMSESRPVFEFESPNFAWEL